jgi:hypothetical protein
MPHRSGMFMTTSHSSAIGDDPLPTAVKCRIVFSMEVAAPAGVT